MKTRQETVEEFLELYRKHDFDENGYDAIAVALIMIVDELAKANERNEKIDAEMAQMKTTFSDKLLEVLRRKDLEEPVTGRDEPDVSERKPIHILDDNFKCPKCGCDDSHFSVDSHVPQKHLFNDVHVECQSCGWEGSYQEVADAAEKRKTAHVVYVKCQNCGWDGSSEGCCTCP